MKFILLSHSENTHFQVIMSINSHHAGKCGEGKGLRPELRGADLDGRELLPGGASSCARLPHS